MDERDENPYSRVLQEDLVNRLKRVEGQARGLQRMILEGRDCEEIATQLAALKSAVNQVGSVFLSSYFSECIAEDLQKGRDISEVKEKFVQLFGKL